MSRICRAHEWRLSLILSLLMVWPALLIGAPSTGLKTKYATGTLTWDHEGQADGFIVRCGTAPGVYTYRERQVDPWPQETLLKGLVRQSGTTYCIVVALTAAQEESTASEEVTIQCQRASKGTGTCQITAVRVPPTAKPLPPRR